MTTTAVPFEGIGVGTPKFLGDTVLFLLGVSQETRNAPVFDFAIPVMIVNISG